MNTTDICFEDIEKEITSNHKTSNKILIKKAYDNINPLDIPEMYNSIHAAYTLAQWGFDAESISAAILYRAFNELYISADEISKTYGSKVYAQILAVVGLDNALTETTDSSKEKLDKIYNEHLVSRKGKISLFIIVATLLSSLQALIDISESENLEAAKLTRNVIIPLLIREKAFKQVDTLEDLCLHIEQPDIYSQIESSYNRLINGNIYTINKTIQLLSEVFTTNNSSGANNRQTMLGGIADFTYNKRSAISIYRQIMLNSNNGSINIQSLINKKNIYQYDFTLVISDDYCQNTSDGLTGKISPSTVFLQLYSTFLADKNITIRDYKYTTYEDSIYYILSDEMDNLYRVFVKSEKEYGHYKLGQIDSVFQADSIPVSVEKKIKVYRRDGSAMYIEAGSTFLDFAFTIHSDIGLHFDYACIKGSKSHYNKYDRISEGDIISIETDSKIEPTLHWFKYVKSHKSMDHLIKYFTKKGGEVHEKE